MLALAATVFVSVRIANRVPTDAAYTTEPSGLIASSVGPRPIGTEAMTAPGAGATAVAVGLWTAPQAASNANRTAGATAFGSVNRKPSEQPPRCGRRVNRVRDPSFPQRHEDPHRGH